MKTNGISNTPSFGMAYKISQNASELLKKCVKEGVSSKRAVESLAYLSKRYGDDFVDLSLKEAGGYQIEPHKFLTMEMTDPSGTHVKRMVTPKALLKRGKAISKRLLGKLNSAKSKEASRKARLEKSFLSGHTKKAVQIAKINAADSYMGRFM